ncbi:hypothetical protein HanPI659440_Chr13g0496151 [Helianthus annuus]|nr:hypothetical protein HanPI659440_Chr13g0496151 [Helianthus annuus]
MSGTKFKGIQTPRLGLNEASTSWSMPPGSSPSPNLNLDLAAPSRPILYWFYFLFFMKRMNLFIEGSEKIGGSPA